MENVKILFSRDDREMIEDLKKEFGGELSFAEEYDFIGDTMLIYVIPATALAVQVLDFILTHIVDKKKEAKENKDLKKEDAREKRIVEINWEGISFISDFLSTFFTFQSSRPGRPHQQGRYLSWKYPGYQCS